MIQILQKNRQAFTRAAALLLAATAAAVGAQTDLLDPQTADVSSFGLEHGAVLSKAELEGRPVLKVEVPQSDSYPGFDLPRPAGGMWDLSGYTGIEVEIVNQGPARLNISVRADNPGRWQDQPWNTGNLWLDAGQSGTVRVTFGSGFKLDPSRVNNIKVLVDKPAQEGVFFIKSIRAVGIGNASAAPAAPAREGQDAVYSPAIDGILLDLGDHDAIQRMRYHDSRGRVEDEKLHVTFQSGSPYPNVQFPVPPGGWDLTAFGGVEVTVTNPGDRAVTAHMRVDNPGRWEDEPWNTNRIRVGAGETETLRMVFGESNDAPGFPLNPARVSAIQVFLIRPRQDTELIFSGLKAWGTPGAAADSATLTSPADRDIPVTPPEWLGQRPPVEGNWVLTLDENFDGDTLNGELWTTRFPWNGPMPGQLQRYAPENVIVEDGILRIKTEKRHGHENNNPALGTREFTSGLIQSYDKFAQRYGYFEARMKLPTARGLWPAFWLMPDRGAESGLNIWRRRDTGVGAMEIDIMEHLTEWGPGRMNAAAHWDGYGASHKHWGTTHVFYGPTPDGWHTFGLLWEPGKLTWFIDGKKVVEWENERISNVAGYIKLNTQMGGWATSDVDVDSLPDFFNVDWIRVWQLEERMP
ncbi:MAG: glycoside hydrolase family 16 protein [Verrucomicrobia bacterium]|nr:glycoside hydrolase family 16 protein [Verrucomicrobiota bacterium]MCH8528087.1 glycoside hydrolase family 16 protein [Kiritimatiellia bacterium]